MSQNDRIIKLNFSDCLLFILLDNDAMKWLMVIDSSLFTF